MNNKIELKSCPFCGHRPSTGLTAYGRCFSAQITCTKCGIEQKVEYTVDQVPSFDDILAMMNEVQGLWNTRVED